MIKDGVENIIIESINDTITNKIFITIIFKYANRDGLLFQLNLNFSLLPIH